MSCKRIYVAATSQHVGKTTSTLGLVKAFIDAGVNVGYCKPVGQQFVDLGDLRVDKDALLFSRVAEFNLIPHIHSPVILGKGTTADFLDDPSPYDFDTDIRIAADHLHREHEMVIYEGTGHPGVGSIANLSNADVAHMLNAPVVMVVEGGIGKTIDKLNMSIALFREKNVKIIGVIVNKVIPEKIDKIKYYVGKKLDEMGLPLLGVLPYDKKLLYPIMSTVLNAVRGSVLFNGDKLNNRVEEILPATVIESDKINDLSNILLVSSIKRIDRAIEAVKRVARQKELDSLPLSGIILTREVGTRLEEDLKEHFTHAEYIEKLGIPVITTRLDTLGAVVKINRIEVKININTPWKSKRAIELIKEHVDLERLSQLCDEHCTSAKTR